MSYQEKIIEITKILNDHVEFAFVLGSFGTPQYRDDSDIDLAVFYRKNIDEKIKTQLWIKLEDLTNRTVQLVEINRIDPIFAKQVINTGRMFINNNSGLMLEWKVINFSKYVDLKIDRKIIEDNLLVRKKL